MNFFSRNFHAMVRKRTAAVAAFVPPSGDKALDDWFAAPRTAAVNGIVAAVGKSIDDEIQLASDILGLHRNSVQA